MEEGVGPVVLTGVNVTLPYGAYDVGGSSCNVVVRASYFGPGVPGSNPGRCTFRCGLEQVTFIPCLVLVKHRKRWTDDRLGQTVTRLDATLCLMCKVQGT